MPSLKQILFAATAAAAALNGCVDAQRLAPKEGNIFLGAWYERLEGDTAKNVNERIKGIPGAGLSFFQTDIDISIGKDPRTALNITDMYLQQLEETGTDAFAYLTIYPFKGFDGVTTEQLTELAERIKRIIQTGRGLFLRLYPEMNGSWFNFGQRPVDFVNAWKKAYDIVTQIIGPELRDRVAFVWAPNSGNGYPYTGGSFSPTLNETDRIRQLDTNGDGLYNENDNPYSPFYPGDEYVDWVGLSIYHYGKEYPWVTNDIPDGNKFEGLMQGLYNPRWGLFPFYTHYCSAEGLPGVSKGNKPFMLAEGGAAYHYAWAPPAGPRYNRDAPDQTTPRREIKRAFWRQYLGRDFIQKYPNVKAICTFEFVKYEEETYRDFTNFGMPAPNATGAAGAAEAGSTAEADATARFFVEDAAAGNIFAPIQWANPWNRSSLTTTLAFTTAAPTATALPGDAPANSFAFTQTVSEVTARGNPKSSASTVDARKIVAAMAAVVAFALSFAL
ncbi:hypothetical protein HDU96_009343 [Phlyctochytrium bullatum]|nr:hypothetical protein HDU96_009343 [Phlyctochytrium bullatum]